MEEFSPATATVLGLPWDYHERCRASLEADYLQPIYLHARSVACECSAAALAQQDGGTCQACLTLMSAILSWDFRCAAPRQGTYIRGPLLPIGAHVLCCAAALDQLLQMAARRKPDELAVRLAAGRIHLIVQILLKAHDASSGLFSALAFAWLQAISGANACVWQWQAEQQQHHREAGPHMDKHPPLA